MILSKIKIILRAIVTYLVYCIEFSQIVNNIIVKKFGGTSLVHLRRVANLIKRDVVKGYNVVVVVSAIADVTNQLVLQAQQISSLNNNQELSEYDVLLSSGEQISCGLLSMLLQSIGVNAKSWLAWQLPIITNNFHSQSRITDIKVECLHQSFYEGYTVAVVAGFQGLFENRLTTFGRGGSDISVVALAIALNVTNCQIFTDVDGIYTADPKIVFKASKLKSISYSEILEMSSSGAKILHSRSIQLAMKYNIKLQVLSTFRDTEGTTVLSDMEEHLVTGITCSTDEALINFSALSVHTIESIVSTGINIHMIHGTSLVISKSDIRKIISLLSDCEIDYDIARISIIGIGVMSNMDVISCMFKVLNRNKIEMLAISTSEIKISIIVKRKYAETLLRDLHTHYNLDI